MSANKTYRLYPKAACDLEDIYLYTYRQHGLHQAEDYIRQLATAMQNLANQPAMAQLRDEVRPDLRAFVVGSHVVFFTVSDDGIAVVRILHQSMDYLRHL